MTREIRLKVVNRVGEFNGPAPVIQMNRGGIWETSTTSNRCPEQGCDGYRCFFQDPYYDVVLCSGTCEYEEYFTIGD